MSPFGTYAKCRTYLIGDRLGGWSGRLHHWRHHKSLLCAHRSAKRITAWPDGRRSGHRSFCQDSSRLRMR